MNRTISIVVPVYNAEAYLNRCVESLLCQTYSDFEIILVDDGSGDNSLELCRRLSARDSRVKIIHQENRGVSAARNAGLEQVRGSYVAFVDADDYVKPDYLQSLMDTMENSGADLVCCNCEEVSDIPNVVSGVPQVSRERFAEKEEAFRDLTEGKEAYGSCVWAKLFKTELAQKVCFRPLKFGEDHIYMFEIFCQFPVIYLSGYCGYYYVRNESSATVCTGAYHVPRCLDELSMYRFKLDHLPEEVSDLRQAYYELYALTAHALARATVLSGDSKTRKENRKMVGEKVAQVLENPDLICRKTKLYLRMYRWAPWLYRRLILIKNGVRIKRN